MSELDKLADIITVILGKDNQARKQAEALLAQSQTADLNQYILLFGNLLNGNHDSSEHILFSSQIVC